MKESLKQKGIKIGRRKVAEIMRKEGLRAIQPPNLFQGQPIVGMGNGYLPIFCWASPNQPDLIVCGYPISLTYP
uniref:hypothetical protein n=1 Tax=Dyadobacter crusticola TaxID=292407 RepID=UPI001E42D787|nr:hypothetical protein [Dyadobacter crusticola]